MAFDPDNLPFLLISPEEAFEAMGQGMVQLEAALPALVGAIQRATLKVEGQLDTSLRRQLVTDTFFLDTAQSGGTLNGYWRLRLSNGCVRASPSIVAQSKRSLAEAYSGYGYPSLTNFEKGIVQLPDNESRQGDYVSIDYESGYDQEDVDEGRVPVAIKQAILLYMPLLLLSSSSATMEPKQAASEASKAGSLDALAMDMLPRYFRRVGGVVKPVSSVSEYVELPD